MSYVLCLRHNKQTIFSGQKIYSQIGRIDVKYDVRPGFPILTIFYMEWNIPKVLKSEWPVGKKIVLVRSLEKIFLEGFWVFLFVVALVKVFRINPEFRILRLTFHRKSMES